MALIGGQSPVMSEPGSFSGFAMVWGVRILLASAVLICTVPNLSQFLVRRLQGISQLVTKRLCVGWVSNEERVVQQMQSSLAAGDSLSAYKLWQRVKSFDVATSFRLVDVVVMLLALGKSYAEVVRELHSAFECNPHASETAEELLEDLKDKGATELHGMIAALLEEHGVVEIPEEVLVVRRMQSRIAEGDHHAAYKLWQRVKSFDQCTSVTLVEVVHLLRALGRSHAEVVDELRSALECNASLAASAVPLLDDLRRRGMIGLLGKVIAMLKEKNISCSGPTRKMSSTTDDSDDDASTQLGSLDHQSTHSETSDTEDDVPHPDSDLALVNGTQIQLATLLRLRPSKAVPPAGYLHAATDEEMKELSKPIKPHATSDDRFDCLRTPDRKNVQAPWRTKADACAPWRKVSTEVVSSPAIDNACEKAHSVAKTAASPGSLTSSLISSQGLRPTRRL